MDDFFDGVGHRVINRGNNDVLDEYAPPGFGAVTLEGALAVPLPTLHNEPLAFYAYYTRMDTLLGAALYAARNGGTPVPEALPHWRRQVLREHLTESFRHGMQPLVEGASVGWSAHTLAFVTWAKADVLVGLAGRAVAPAQEMRQALPRLARSLDSLCDAPWLLWPALQLRAMSLRHLHMQTLAMAHAWADVPPDAPQTRRVLRHLLAAFAALAVEVWPRGGDAAVLNMGDAYRENAGNHGVQESEIEDLYQWDAARQCLVDKGLVRESPAVVVSNRCVYEMCGMLFSMLTACHAVRCLLPPTPAAPGTLDMYVFDAQAPADLRFETFAALLAAARRAHMAKIVDTGYRDDVAVDVRRAHLPPCLEYLHCFDNLGVLTLNADVLENCVFPNRIQAARIAALPDAPLAELEQPPVAAAARCVAATRVLVDMLCTCGAHRDAVLADVLDERAALAARPGARCLLARRLGAGAPFLLLIGGAVWAAAPALGAVRFHEPDGALAAWLVAAARHHGPGSPYGRLFNTVVGMYVAGSEVSEHTPAAVAAFLAAS